jgi:hypothetical protein
MWESFAIRPAGFAKATVGITSARMRVVLALLAVKVRAVAVIAAVPWDGSSSVKPRLQSTSRPRKCSSDNRDLI